MPVKIVIPRRTGACADQEFTGSIDQIFPTADPGSHQFVVKVFIQNPDGSVMSGMFARLVVNRALAERLMVPAEAIPAAVSWKGYSSSETTVGPRFAGSGRAARWASGWKVIAGLEPGETVVTWSGARLKDSRESRCRSEDGNRRTDRAGLYRFEAHPASMLSALLWVSSARSIRRARRSRRSSFPWSTIFVPSRAPPRRKSRSESQNLSRRFISQIQGVEYIYSMSRPDFAVITVRYVVGENMEDSLVKLWATILKNMDRKPVGWSFPLLKTTSIDDVPVLGVHALERKVRRVFASPSGCRARRRDREDRQRRRGRDRGRF